MNDNSLCSHQYENFVSIKTTNEPSEFSVSGFFLLQDEGSNVERKTFAGYEPKKYPKSNFRLPA